MNIQKQKSMRVCLMVLVSAVCLSVAVWSDAVQQEILFDVNEASHTFLGFGTQLWAGDLSVEPVLRDLKVKYVRIGLGRFSGQIDVEGWGDAEHDASFRNEPWKAHRATWKLLQQYDVQAIYNVFGAPKNWLMNKPRKNSLNPDYYGHYTKRLAAALASLRRNGIKPVGIEIFNEQDGTWSCYVPPDGYSKIVRLLRQELDKRGLQEVLIYGPGVAHIDTGDEERWIEAMDQETADMIGVWSIHGYQWDKKFNSNPAYGRDSYRKGFERSLLKKDPDRSKPVFITEFAPYKLYDNEDDAIELPDFPARAVEDALSYLNCGAGAVLFWEAADMSWSSERHHGLIRLDKTRRPVFLAFQTILEGLPVGATLLKAPEIAGGEVYASAFLKDEQVLVALVNNSGKNQVIAIRISGLQHSFVPVRFRVFDGHRIAEKSVRQYDSQSVEVQVPKNGVASVLISCRNRL